MSFQLSPRIWWRNQAARETGFEGGIVGICNEGDRDPADLRERYRYLGAWESSNDPKVLSDSLNQRLLTDRTGTLSDTTNELMSLYFAGVEKSVVNMSRSMSEVKSMEMMLDEMLPEDPDEPEQVKQAREQRNKVALALGIPKAKVESDDPEIRSEVRDDLLQRLLDRIATVDSHPDYLDSYLLIGS